MRWRGELEPSLLFGTAVLPRDDVAPHVNGFDAMRDEEEVPVLWVTLAPSPVGFGVPGLLPAATLGVPLESPLPRGHASREAGGAKRVATDASTPSSIRKLA